MYVLFENKLLDFYRKRMTIWALVFKPIRKRFTCYIVVQLLVLMTWVTSITYDSNNLSEKDFWFIGYFIAFEVILFFSFGFIIFRPAKNKLFNKYKIELYGEEWEPFRLLVLKDFLIQEKIINGKNDAKSKKKDELSLDFCIERLEKRFERRKKTRILTILSSYSAMFIGFVVPVWAAFNNWVYSKTGFVTMGQAFGYLVIVIFLVISVFILFIFFKHFFVEDLLQWEDQRIFYLIEMLQSIKFSLNHFDYLGSFEKEDHIKESITKVLGEYESDKLKEKERKKSAWWNFNNRKNVMMSGKGE